MRKSIRKLSSLFILSLFLVSLVPLALAHEGVVHATPEEAREHEKETRALRIAVKSDAGVRVGDDTDGSGSTEKSTNGRAVSARVEAKAEFRARHLKLLEEASKRCDDKEDAEACKVRLNKRLTLVNSLDEKAALRLEKFTERREEVSAHIAELRANAAFKKFRADAKARVVAAGELKSAEDRFVKAHDKVEDARLKQKENLDGLTEKQKQWKEDCAENEESESCKELHAEMVLEVKAYFSHVLDAQAALIEKITERVKGSETLSEQEVTDMLSKLGDLTAQITEVRAEVDALSETSTRDDVKAVRDNVKELTKAIKLGVEFHSGHVVNARIGGILMSSEHLRERLAKVLERMTENGADTTELDALVETFDGLLKEASTAYEEAQALFEQAATLTADERAEVLKEAQDKKRVARDKLQEAHKVLREIHAQIKEQRQTDVLEEVTVEASAETEAEVEAQVNAEATAETGATV